jgi:hypothetical protein
LELFHTLYAHIDSEHISKVLTVTISAGTGDEEFRAHKDRAGDALGWQLDLTDEFALR